MLQYSVNNECVSLRIEQTEKISATYILRQSPGAHKTETESQYVLLFVIILVLDSGFLWIKTIAQRQREARKYADPH